MSVASEREVVVVGAGAAGLWAAAACARAGTRVLLLEKTRRSGTKILASGGTRCNLTTTLEADEAARLFGTRGERFLRPALRALPPSAVVAHFEGLGVPCVEAPLEKVFPASQRARDIRDALLRDAEEAGVEIRYEQPVVAVEALPEGGFRLAVDGEGPLRAERLLLCPGGQSFPSTGTTGDGYAWLRGLGLAVVPPVPALVPLSSPASWVAELTGIAVQEAEARLVDPKGRERLRRRRPLLFTHHGLSGPGAMDLSGEVAAAPRAEGFQVVVDLCADLPREELRELLVQASRATGSPRLARALAGRFPRRLVEAVCRQAGVAPNPPSSGIRKAERHALVESFKALRVPVGGTLGFDKAEVTRGGLDLRELDPRSMEVGRHPGLFVFGELLDLDGPIGGLNFQAAFASAELAARRVASIST